MNNGNDATGITVVTTIPEAHQSDIDVNSDIQITFSADLDRSTLNNCIMVLEDYNGIYSGVQSLKNTSQFNIVKGSLSYDDKTLSFTPNEALNVDTRYIVIINNNIKDITGSPLNKKYVFAFHTEVTKSLGACEITYPTFGLICSTIPQIKWKDIEAPSYILQVSKSNTFESLLYETFVVSGDDNTFIEKEEIEIQPEEIQSEPETYKVITSDIDITQTEGVYYVRVKGEGGQWSEVCQFFLKEVTDAVVAQDDQDDSIYLKDFLEGLEDEIEILEYFPENDSINNSLKTNIFYIKMKGEVDESRINLSDCEVVGEAFSEDDDGSNGYKDYTHGTVDGSWTYVYDKDNDCTYLIFTPIVPEDKEEVTVIQTISGEEINTISSSS